MKASVNFSMNTATFTSPSGVSQRIQSTPELIAKAKQIAYQHTVGQAYAFLTKRE